MPATYEPIATTTLGSAAATITFSSIPSTYTDLRLVITVTGASGAAGQDLQMQYNSDSTSTNYSFTQIYGNGSTVSTSTQGGNRVSGYVYVSDTIPQFYTMDLFSYAGSTFKTGLFTGNGDTNGGANNRVGTVVSLWRNTAAISSISLYLSGSFNMAAGTTATLYGIKNA
jgi:hypothetical protein